MHSPTRALGEPARLGFAPADHKWFGVVLAICALAIALTAGIERKGAVGTGLTAVFGAVFVALAWHDVRDQNHPESRRLRRHATRDRRRAALARPRVAPGAGRRVGGVRRIDGPCVLEWCRRCRRHQDGDAGRLRRGLSGRGHGRDDHGARRRSGGARAARPRSVDAHVLDAIWAVHRGGRRCRAAEIVVMTGGAGAEG